MRKIYILAFSACALFVISCTNQGGQQHATDQKQVIVLPEATVELKDKQVEEALMGYLKVKNALTAANVQTAQTAAETLGNELNKIEGCENTAELAEAIAATADLQVQREKFSILSSDMIALLENAEVTSGSVFVQYCPMANEGNGAYWMASQKEIRNPYYGEDMLECGEVKNELKPEN